MKNLRILGIVLNRTKADRIILGFVLFLFIVAAIIQLVEPGITRYGNSLWYCYSVISTAGFGDIVAVTFIGKACSVLLTIYATFVVAIATGVVVSFYNQKMQAQKEETLIQFIDKLEHLPELSPEELARIAEKVKTLR